LISEILSCVEYKWKFCFYVLYFQVYKEKQSECSLCKFMYKIYSRVISSDALTVVIWNFDWQYIWCHRIN
jgi:hypothetical protein